jgi:hypothetical protein
MPRKKNETLQNPTPQVVVEEMHNKKKVAIDVKLYFLEEFAMLLFELFRVHEAFEQESHRPGRNRKQ